MNEGDGLRTGNLRSRQTELLLFTVLLLLTLVGVASGAPVDPSALFNGASGVPLDLFAFGPAGLLVSIFGIAGLTRNSTGTGTDQVELAAGYLQSGDIFAAKGLIDTMNADQAADLLEKVLGFKDPEMRLEAFNLVIDRFFLRGEVNASLPLSDLLLEALERAVDSNEKDPQIRRAARHQLLRSDLVWENEGRVEAVRRVVLDLPEENEGFVFTLDGGKPIGLSEIPDNRFGRMLIEIAISNDPRIGSHVPPEKVERPIDEINDDRARILNAVLDSLIEARPGKGSRFEDISDLQFYLPHLRSTLSGKMDADSPVVKRVAWLAEQRKKLAISSDRHGDPLAALNEALTSWEKMVQEIKIKSDPELAFRLGEVPEAAQERLDKAKEALDKIGEIREKLKIADRPDGAQYRGGLQEAYYKLLPLLEELDVIKTREGLPVIEGNIVTAPDDSVLQKLYLQIMVVRNMLEFLMSSERYRGYVPEYLGQLEVLSNKISTRIEHLRSQGRVVPRKYVLAAAVALLALIAPVSAAGPAMQTSLSSIPFMGLLLAAIAVVAAVSLGARTYWGKPLLAKSDELPGKILSTLILAFVAMGLLSVLTLVGMVAGGKRGSIPDKASAKGSRDAFEKVIGGFSSVPKGRVDDIMEIYDRSAFSPETAQALVEVMDSLKTERLFATFNRIMPPSVFHEDMEWTRALQKFLDAADPKDCAAALEIINIVLDSVVSDPVLQVEGYDAFAIHKGKMMTLAVWSVIAMLLSESLPDKHTIRPQLRERWSLIFSKLLDKAYREDHKALYMHSAWVCVLTGDISHAEAVRAEEYEWLDEIEDVFPQPSVRKIRRLCLEWMRRGGPKNAQETLEFLEVMQGKPLPLNPVKSTKKPDAVPPPVKNLPAAIATGGVRPIRDAAAATVSRVPAELKGSAIAGNTVFLLSSSIGENEKTRLESFGKAGMNAVGFSFLPETGVNENEFIRLPSVPLEETRVEMWVKKKDSEGGPAVIYIRPEGEYVRGEIELLKYFQRYVERLNEDQSEWKNELEKAAGAIRPAVMVMDFEYGNFPEDFQFEGAVRDLVTVFAPKDMSNAGMRLFKLADFCLAREGQAPKGLGLKQYKHRKNSVIQDDPAGAVPQLLQYDAVLRDKRAFYGVQGGFPGMVIEHSVSGDYASDLRDLQNLQNTAREAAANGCDIQLVGDENTEWMTYDPFLQWIRNEKIDCKVYVTEILTDKNSTVNVLKIKGLFEAGFNVRIDMTGVPAGMVDENGLKAIGSYKQRTRREMILAPSAADRQQVEAICGQFDSFCETTVDQENSAILKNAAGRARSLFRIDGSSQWDIIRFLKENPVSMVTFFFKKGEIKGFTLDALRKRLMRSWQEVRDGSHENRLKDEAGFAERMDIGKLSREEIKTALNELRQVPEGKQAPVLHELLDAYEAYKAQQQEAVYAFKEGTCLETICQIADSIKSDSISTHVHALRNKADWEPKEQVTERMMVFLESLMERLVDEAYPSSKPFENEQDARDYRTLKWQAFSRLIVVNGETVIRGHKRWNQALTQSDPDERLEQMIMVSRLLVPQGMLDEARSLLIDASKEIRDLRNGSNAYPWHLMYVEALDEYKKGCENSGSARWEPAIDKDKDQFDMIQAVVSVLTTGFKENPSFDRPGIRKMPLGTLGMLYNAACIGERLEIHVYTKDLCGSFKKQIRERLKNELVSVSPFEQGPIDVDSTSAAFELSPLMLVILTHTKDKNNIFSSSGVHFSRDQEEKIKALLLTRAEEQKTPQGISINGRTVTALMPFYIDAVANVGEVPKPELTGMSRELSARAKKERVDTITLVGTLYMLKQYAEKKGLGGQAVEAGREAIEGYRRMLEAA